VAAVVGAEVVAAAGEVARCRGGCLRWRDHQRHLPPSLQLFGFNGLVAAPVGGRGRGPLRNGARIEAAITAVTPSWGDSARAVTADFQRDRASVG
jgi:hypothetical protein